MLQFVISYALLKTKSKTLVAIPRRLVDLDGGIRVELCDTRGRDLISGLADILGSQEELG